MLSNFAEVEFINSVFSESVKYFVCHYWKIVIKVRFFIYCTNFSKDYIFVNISKNIFEKLGDYEKLLTLHCICDNGCFWWMIIIRFFFNFYCISHYCSYPGQESWYKSEPSHRDTFFKKIKTFKIGIQGNNLHNLHIFL